MLEPWKGLCSVCATLNSRVETLYKYVTAKRALTCIPEVGDGTLRATQPASLNDPFECAVMTLEIFRDKTEWNDELAKALTRINERKPITAEDVQKARCEHGSLFTRQLLTQQLSTRFGIVSFTTNFSHPLMWSNYTTDGSGFVIGYDMDILRAIAGQEEYLRKVDYLDQLPPVIEPATFRPTTLLSRKSDHWSYESEWRLIVELNGTIGTGEADRHGQPINLVQIPNDGVVSVHYTERTSPESVKLIRDRLTDKNNRYRADKPRKLILSSTSYSYEEAPDGC